MTNPLDPQLFLSKTGFRRVTATTNANLTGPITSVGNVTTISTSIALPGSPTTTTQTPGTNNTTIATTAFVEQEISAAIVASGELIWNEVTGPTPMLVNNGYIANNSSLVVLTLPVTATQGKIVRVAGKGAGGWQVAQNSGQTIHVIGTDTTTGVTGSVTSQEVFDCLELLCTSANTNWTAITMNGNLTIV